MADACKLQEKAVRCANALQGYLPGRTFFSSCLSAASSVPSSAVSILASPSSCSEVCRAATARAGKFLRMQRAVVL